MKKKFLLLALIFITGCYRRTTVEKNIDNTFTLYAKGSVSPVTVEKVEIDGAEYLVLIRGDSVLGICPKVGK